LHVSQTTFGVFTATNRSLDYAVIPAVGPYKTIREKYVSFPYVLERSVLGNPFSANLVVVSRNPRQNPNDQVLIRLRSEKVALYRNCYQLAASGYVSLGHIDASGKPNPFVAAVDEAKQEIADSLIIPPSDVRMIGLALNWEDLDLNFFGFAETELPIAQLLGDTRRDDYEGYLEATPFTPSNVMEHIARNRWEPVSVMGMCSALISHFGRPAVEDAARRVPETNWRAFAELR
jgi:hypothetical protein